jgi:hypothetical protein
MSERAVLVGDAGVVHSCLHAEHSLLGRPFEHGVEPPDYNHGRITSRYLPRT